VVDHAGRRPAAARCRPAALVAVVAALGATLVLTQADHASPATTMTAAALNSAFNAYGDAGGHWTGGDGTTSVAVSEGRVVWLFADTFLGTVNPDHSRAANSPLINNSAVVQNGTKLGMTLHGGSRAAPQALVMPTQPGEHLWVTDGTVESGVLRVFYNRYRKTGTGTLDFTLNGTVLATFALPSLGLRSVIDLPVGTDIHWGAAVLPDDEYTYIYGTAVASDGGPVAMSGRMTFAHVARARTGHLDGPWQFWTGSTWSAAHADAARLLSGVGATFSVQRVGRQYVLVTHENNLPFDPQFAAYTADSPTGPFVGPTYLYTAPEPKPGCPAIVYGARLHPEIAVPGKLLMSYDVNSVDYRDTLANARLNRPRFVEFAWPPPPSGPGVPGAPTGIAVTGQDHDAYLTWSTVAGATSYRLYQRDVTAGQTHFARRPATVADTRHRVASLISGHRYEFKVTAVNNAGEGPSSTTVSITPQSTNPGPEAIRLPCADSARP
jgi:Fibronectin type III domain